MLKHIEHRDGNNHRAQHHNAAYDAAKAEAFAIARLGIDIRHINIANHQRGAHEHITIHTAHQRGQQTGKHQANQSDAQRPEQFLGGHAPRHVGIFDEGGVAAVQREHNQRGDDPADGAKSFDEVAGNEPHARIVFALGRAAASNNEMRREHDADHIHNHNGDNGVQRKFAGRAAAHNFKSGRG